MLLVKILFLLRLLAADQLYSLCAHDQINLQNKVPVFLIVQLISTEHGVDQPVEAAWNKTPIGPKHVWFLGTAAVSELDAAERGTSLAPIVDSEQGPATLSIHGHTLEITKPAAETPRSVGRTAMLCRDDRRNPKYVIIAAWITWDRTGKEPNNERIAQPNLERILGEAQAAGQITNASAKKPD